jgi:zinc protease
MEYGKDREKAIDRKLYTHKGVRSNIFKRKMEIPQATTALVWMAPCEYNTRNRLLANIAGQILSKRCLDEIREKNGKSYSPSAASGVSFDFKPEARIQIFTASNPDGYEETVNQLKEILKGMTEKVDQIELDKVKEFLIKDNKQSLKNNNYWLSLMTDKLLYGFDVRTDFDKVIKSITTDDIKSFTKSVIDANNMIEVVMIPE